MQVESRLVAGIQTRPTLRDIVVRLVNAFLFIFMSANALIHRGGGAAIHTKTETSTVELLKGGGGGKHGELLGSGKERSSFPTIL